jgi:phosphoglycolate phosphatase-like HAD superfamily hydrolase
MWALLSLDGVVLGPQQVQASAVQAASHYLEHICCVERGDRLITPALLAEFTRVEGFEAPLELASSLVLFFLSSLSPTLRPPVARPTRGEQVREAFAELSLRYGELMSHAERDLAALAQEASARGGGFQGLQRALGYDSVETYILRSGALDVATREAGLPGDASYTQREQLRALPDNLLGRLVEQSYLGPARLQERHGATPEPLDQDQGLIEREAAQVTLEELEALAGQARLALVSGRAPWETEFLLAQLGLDHLSWVVITPEQGGQRGGDLPLAQAWGRLQELEQAPVFFVGALPAQVRGARACGMKAVGLARDRTWHRPLRQAGADGVIGRISTLSRAWGR